MDDFAAQFEEVHQRLQEHIERQDQGDGDRQLQGPVDLHERIADGQGEDRGAEDCGLEQEGLLAGNRNAGERQLDSATSAWHRAASVAEEPNEAGPIRLVFLRR